MKTHYYFSCGGWDRTTGLQVMSLTSYHCSTPRYIFGFAAGATPEIECKGTAFFWYMQIYA